MACQAQGWLLAAAVFCLLALFYFPKNSSLHFILPFTVWDGALNFCLENVMHFYPVCMLFQQLFDVIVL